MQGELGLGLLLVRCAMLLLITVTLGSYHDPNARQRWGVSLIAVCAAGASLSWALFSVLVAIREPSCTPATDEVWPTLFVFGVLIPILYTRGNVAKLLPRVKWSAR